MSVYKAAYREYMQLKSTAVLSIIDDFFHG